MKKIDYSLHYRRFHDESESHADEMAAYLASHISPHLNLPPEARILDVGCGFGFALRALRKLGYNNTTGLEISKEQSEIAKKSGSEVIVTTDSIKWMLDNVESFDFVILFDVLEHQQVDYQIDLLNAIFKVLRSGGKLMLTVPNANSILQGRWRYIDFTHFSSFTEHSLYFVLRNAGFEQIWIDNTKGIGRFPRRFWLRTNRPLVRKWFVRWWWLQVFKAEIPFEKIEDISFELNLVAVATKNI
jgi:SAM-dependent methyltransferase